ncbi:cysteine-type endopeptidase [Malassezia pachydermatis]|uniref:separase n=1 Tax=Malassezia pachydermatis TaxID=77020 RepID=A0A0M8MS27_9BASI|nr:cysteine-type endopeptidase [Malassezia pachydermatis]KOS15637.1 cysteine-type endopeptidase [Malassezia pachydermatis]
MAPGSRSTAPPAKAPPLPWKDLLQVITAARPLRRADVAAVIAHLGAGTLARALSLYTSSSTLPTSAGVGWHADASWEASPSRVRMAKQTVNAVLTALQTMASARAAPKVDVVLPHIDCFRIAMSALEVCGTDASVLAPVALSVLRRMSALPCASQALTELVALCMYLQRDASSACVSVHEPGTPHTRLMAIVHAKVDECNYAYFTEALALAVACGLPLLTSVDEVASLWPALYANYELFLPLATCTDEVTRLAYATERAISHALSSAPSSEHAWPLRLGTLRMLIPISTIDDDALWQRVLRVCQYHVRTHGQDSLRADMPAFLTWAEAHQRLQGAAYDAFLQWMSMQGLSDALSSQEEASAPHAVDATTTLQACMSLQDDDLAAALPLFSVPLASDVSSSLPRVMRGFLGQVNDTPLSPTALTFVETAWPAFLACRSDERPWPYEVDAVHLAHTVCQATFDEAQPGTARVSMWTAMLPLSSAPTAFTISTHLFHYGSRLYATQAYAYAAPWIEAACRACEHALSSDSAQDAWYEAYYKQTHVLGGAYQHMAQWESAYRAYERGALLTKRYLEAHVSTLDHLTPPPMIVRLWTSAHHVAVFGLLQPRLVLDVIAAWPATVRTPIHVWLMEALRPMLLRDDAPAAFTTTMDDALAALDPTLAPGASTQLWLGQAEWQVLRGDPISTGPVLATAAKLPASPHREYVYGAWHLLQCLASIRACEYTEALDAMAQAEKPSLSSAPRRTARTMRTRSTRTNQAQTPRTPPARTPSQTTKSETPRVPPLVALWDLAAEAWLHAGMPGAAIRAWHAALAAMPEAASTAMYRTIQHRLADVWLALEAVEAAAQCLPALDDDMPARWHLTHAHVAAKQGDIGRAHALYTQAIAAASQATPEPTSAWDRWQAKVARVDLQAHATDVHVALCVASHQYAYALRSSLHALRLRLRMAMVVSQVGRVASDDEDVFDSASSQEAPAGPRITTRAWAMWHWRTGTSLHAAYLRQSRLHAHRGAVRDADAFARECVDFSAERGVPLVYAEALAWRATWLDACGQADEAQQDAQLVRGYAQGHAVPAQVWTSLLSTQEDSEAARDWYDQVCASLPTSLPVLTTLRDYLLCRSASATYAQTNDLSAAMDALADADSPTAWTVRAQLHHREAQRVLRTDALYAMLPEMARLMPGVATAPSRPSAAAKRAIAHVQTAMAEARRVLDAEAQADLRDVRAALDTCRDGVVTQALLTHMHYDAAGRDAALYAHAACTISVQRDLDDALIARQRIESAYPAALSHDKAAPRPWVLNGIEWPATEMALLMMLSHDRQDLICARFGDGYPPLHVSIPIARQSHRDGDEEAWTVDTVLATLSDMVHTSNERVQGAKDVTALDARKAWWTERRAMDQSLGSLLATIQATWLGAFLGLFFAWPPPSQLEAWRAKVDVLVHRACGAHPRARSKALGTVPLPAMACLVAMPSYENDALEDWLHFAMDAIQQSGAPVAQDEVDLDACCVDLRGLLDEWHARWTPPEDHHLSLLLDGALTQIPWESMPALRAHSVTRRTSFQPYEPPMTLSPARTAYVLNPGGDLHRSEERFAPLFQAQSTWQGTIGTPPLMDQIPTALATQDTFLYIGHSAAEMYMHPTRLRDLTRCAATMLWGCSSAALRVHGTYPPSGTPYLYALAQCPSLVVALWDTTDRELDGVCHYVLQHVGLLPGSETTCTLPRAMAMARSQCKLPFLTGAACVVYGTPVSWCSGRR